MKQGKHQRTSPTGRTSSPTGRTCRKIGIKQLLSVELKVLPVELYGTCGNCPRIQSGREGTFVSEPKWENHFGGGYKRRRTQVLGRSFLVFLVFSWSLEFFTSRVSVLIVFLHFLSGTL